MSKMIVGQCLLLCCIIASRIEATPGDNVQVKISTGQIIGEISVTEGNTTSYVFRGIPYAVPPVGNLRFSPPIAAKSWNGIYNATYHRSMCTQQTNTSVNGSENCLFLNVYTAKLPTKQSPNPKLPCIVWIHGGGFVGGSGDLDLHGADRFLDHGVLVISINYRLSVFGFLSTEDLVIPGNYGLKDQVLALKWVKRNVAVFGGDPNNVTIMGESAGSVSVSFLVLSKIAQGLFHKAIMESGTGLVPWSEARNARKLAFRIGLTNHILTCNSTILLNSLRKVEYKKLLQSTTLPQLLDLWDPLNGLPLAPVKEEYSADAVILGDNYENMEVGNFSKVPILLGFNSLEGRAAKFLPWYSNILLLEQFNLFPSRLVPEDMNANRSGDNAAGNKIKSYYFHNKPVVVGNNTINFISDSEFVRGIVQSAYLQSQFTACYLYRFAFTGGVAHESFNPEGVSHAEELQFLWLNNASVQVTPAAKLTTIRMVTLWTNFAKTGNPTPALDEYVNVTWPLSNSTGGSTVHYYNIGATLQAKINPEVEQMTFWKSLYDTYGHQPYNTY